MGLINLPSTVFSTTWAQRPAASTMSGKIIRISDIGPGGCTFVSNGTRWKPLGGSCVIAQTNTTSAVTGTVSETLLYSFTVPGGLMSTNGILEFRTLLYYTNSANTKTSRIRFTSLSGALLVQNAVTTTDTGQYLHYWANNGTTNSQKRYVNNFGVTASTVATTSIDTTADFLIVYSATLTNTGEFMNLEGTTVTYIEG